MIPHVESGNVSNEVVFFGGDGHNIHVTPTRNNRAIKDYAGNILANGPATGAEWTFGFKVQQTFHGVAMREGRPESRPPSLFSPEP